MDNKTKFRYVEKCLYQYPQNVIRLCTLHNALDDLRGGMSVRGQGYEPISGGGDVGDPVGIRAARIADIEVEIRALEAITRPIGDVAKMLGADNVLPDSPKAGLRRILELYYFGGNTNSQVAQAMGMTDRNVYKMRCRLVEMMVACLGV